MTKTKINYINQITNQNLEFFHTCMGGIELVIALSPEAEKSISEEDVVIENIKAFILLISTFLGLFAALKQNLKRAFIAIASFV